MAYFGKETFPPEKRRPGFREMFANWAHHVPSSMLLSYKWELLLMTGRFLFVQISLSLSIIINYTTFYYFPKWSFNIYFRKLKKCWWDFRGFFLIILNRWKNEWILMIHVCMDETPNCSLNGKDWNTVSNEKLGKTEGA